MQTIKWILLLPVRIVWSPFKLTLRLVRSRRVRRGVRYALPAVKLLGGMVLREGRKRLVRRGP
ncbi:MAG TPA: hypothetical protein ENK18_01665 [Deltaproteobacteria bacterium]|nr:hypothetical protein [Deltaproteobacteria bacterium]